MVQPQNCTNILMRKMLRASHSLWASKYVPDDFAAAQIASIYKKGDHDNPENYRLISLLNATYKKYAYMLKTRIADAVDSQVWSTQFGFRKGKSTAEALFCVSRLTDVVDQGHEQQFLVFLDLEKAFDKMAMKKCFNRPSGSTHPMKT